MRITEQPENRFKPCYDVLVSYNFQHTEKEQQLGLKEHRDTYFL